MKIDVISGFLGSGKTTLINKLLEGTEERVAIIENEFGEVGIDGALINPNFRVTELTAGCICCSLVTDFREAILEIAKTGTFDRIIIEPSGIGQLSDVLRIFDGLAEAAGTAMDLDRCITVVDASACIDYIDNFGAFYLDQIEQASLILFSFLDELTQQEQTEVLDRIRAANPKARIWTEAWFDMDGEMLQDLVTSIALFTEESGADHEDKEQPAFESCTILHPRKVGADDLAMIAEEAKDLDFGTILRMKGILETRDGAKMQLDYTPYHETWKETDRSKKTSLVVIGIRLDKSKLMKHWVDETRVLL